ncbi:MAG TPA: hypothetical protein VEO01_19545 [Pseudonocardiaceae bacterium]|nr:hypothetical protein [Pseudonocardiaceae bacterium]
MPWRAPATGGTSARKLTAESVAEIRSRWAAGGVEQRQLATEYGVSCGLVTAIVRGVIWKEASGPIMPPRHRSGVPHIKARLPAEMGPCVACGRQRVRIRDWREDPDGWRARGCVKNNSHDRCSSCADKARRGDVSVVRRRVVAPRVARRPEPVVVKQPLRKPVRRPRRAPLSPGELVRLRALVGLPAVLPEELAS